MKIKLLNNGTGVIISRQPKVVRTDEEFSFEGAHDGATAIFESNGNSYYRELKEGSCVLPFKAVDGVIKLVVAVMDGKVGSPRWVCEEVIAEKLRDGSVLLLPNDKDIPGKVARICIENHDLREKNAELAARMDKLDKVFEKKSHEMTVLKDAMKELYAIIKKNNQM